MSGIAGIVRLDGGHCERGLLERMNAFQAFRGPHGNRIWSDGGAGFGHSLLKLSDAEPSTPQPATLDGSVWITADARIDAQAELIAALRGAGRDASAGASDAELLLHAYHAWGKTCVERILGDFTFAIWDNRNRQLFCAVDAFGIRPFYFAHVAGAFVFSNTLDCVRLHPGVSARLDDTAVGDFLLFGHYQDRDRTIYADIRRLAPAHSLDSTPGGITVRRYWDVESEKELEAPKPSDVVEQFRLVLDAATRDRLRSRQVAVYMSGGLDSTHVAASAARVLGATTGGSRITAYTTVFGNLIPDDEETYARQAAEHLGLEFRLQSRGGLAPFDWIGHAHWPPPEPTNDPALSSELSATAQVAGDHRLALTGWEGDAPLAASFPHHWAELCRRHQWRRLGAELRWHALRTRRLPPFGVRAAIGRWRWRLPPPPPWLDADFARRAGLSERWRFFARAHGLNAPRHPRHRNLQNVFWSMVFDLYDPGWTGCALEAAHPLMDRRMIRFLLQLPPIPWCFRKHLHREAARGILPESLIDRPKASLAADPVRAAIELKRLPPALVGNALRAASEYVDSDGFPPYEGVDFLDEQWVNARPVSLGGWLLAKREWRYRP